MPAMFMETYKKILWKRKTGMIYFFCVIRCTSCRHLCFGLISSCLQKKLSPTTASQEIEKHAQAKGMSLLLRSGFEQGSVSGVRSKGSIPCA